MGSVVGWGNPPCYARVIDGNGWPNVEYVGIRKEWNVFPQQMIIKSIERDCV